MDHHNPMTTSPYIILPTTDWIWPDDVGTAVAFFVMGSFMMYAIGTVFRTATASNSTAVKSQKTQRTWECLWGGNVRMLMGDAIVLFCRRRDEIPVAVKSYAMVNIAIEMGFVFVNSLTCE
jgi:hypothetical protein